MTQNLACYTSHVDKMSLYSSQFGGSSTHLKRQNQTENPLLLNFSDKNEYPFPNSPNFLKVSVNLNFTIFQSQFSNSTVWVYAAFSSKYQPKSIETLKLDFDEAFVRSINIGTQGEELIFLNFKTMTTF
jgi:hypothetical protein